MQERLGRYLWVVGREDEAAAAYREAVATLPADPPSAERARVVAAEGQLLMLRGHAREAIARCEEALAVARAVGARAEEGQALNTLGACRSGLGEHEAGEACLREALAIALELQHLDDVGRAYVNLSDCVDQAGRIDEAARLALDGFEAGRSLGLGTGYRAMLLSEAAQRRFRAGRWDDAERLADRALAHASGRARGGDRARDRRPDRGRARRSRRRARTASRVRATSFRTDASAMWNAPVDAGVAELELLGRTSRPRRGTWSCAAWREPRARSTRSTPPACTGSACAWRPSSRRRHARGSTSRASARRRPGRRTLAERIAGQVAATPAGTPAPELLLYAALCTAELTRVDARARSGRVGRRRSRAPMRSRIPAAGAYARWRQAEAALALGQRHAAAEPLRAAAASAARLGARPLLEEIRALARRGRIELGDAQDPAAADGLDLTAREREVLRLVAAGRTNREIGAELFISPKTASVHVSRILRKLNVRGRVEAAAFAHRRGLE